MNFECSYASTINLLDSKTKVQTPIIPSVVLSRFVLSAKAVGAMGN